MIIIPMTGTNHDFQKVNLVTQRGKGGSFDEYKCSHCGLKGKRYSLGDMLMVKKSKICTNQPKQESLGKVKIADVDVRAWGLISGDVVERVACPAEYMNRYADSVWVFSPSRNEPVRLLPEEYSHV